ncbi:hypothetical protein I7I48_03643 [Histoplasma ohiense]|nr:hypothetical protein I7I48_03643 [Histoplasma ohiense (nom. inval.)]
MRRLTIPHILTALLMLDESARSFPSLVLIDKLHVLPSITALMMVRLHRKQPQIIKNISISLTAAGLLTCTSIIHLLRIIFTIYLQIGHCRLWAITRKGGSRADFPTLKALEGTGCRRDICAHPDKIWAYRGTRACTTSTVSK